MSSARFPSPLTSSRPFRIQTFARSASVTVSAFKELRRSLQMCRDLEKTRSTETLVAGIEADGPAEEWYDDLALADVTTFQTFTAAFNLKWPKPPRIQDSRVTLMSRVWT